MILIFLRKTIQLTANYLKHIYDVSQWGNSSQVKEGIRIDKIYLFLKKCLISCVCAFFVVTLRFKLCSLGSKLSVDK